MPSLTNRRAVTCASSYTLYLCLLFLRNFYSSPRNPKSLHNFFQASRSVGSLYSLLWHSTSFTTHPQHETTANTYYTRLPYNNRARTDSHSHLQSIGFMDNILPTWISPACLFLTPLCASTLHRLHPAVVACPTCSRYPPMRMTPASSRVWSLPGSHLSAMLWIVSLRPHRQQHLHRREVNPPSQHHWPRTAVNPPPQLYLHRRMAPFLNFQICQSKSSEQSIGT